MTTSFSESFETAKNMVETEGFLPAVHRVLEDFELKHVNYQLSTKPNDDPKKLVLTTEGDFGPAASQTIRVPDNLFEFPMEMVVNMLAHETYHVEQKTMSQPITDKNEREFQAYYEGVFPSKFAQLPPCPIWLKKQLAQQALRYFGLMQPFGVLYFNYLSQKYRLEEFLADNA
jgi:hypothetical protein